MSNAPTDNKNVEDKITAMYLYAMSPYDMAVGLFGDGAGTYRDRAHNSKWSDKTAKYSKLFEGGNANPISRYTLEAMAEFHPNADLRKHAEKRMTENKIIGIADEVLGSTLDLRTTILEGLESQKEFFRGISGEHPLLSQINKQIAELSRMEGDDGYQYDSLGQTERNPDVVSEKNSAVYISEMEAMLLSTLNGEPFNPHNINGWKPKISYVSPDLSESLKMKTWMVYVPKYQPIFDETGANALAMGSSLKSFGSLDTWSA